MTWINQYISTSRGLAGAAVAAAMALVIGACGAAAAPTTTTVSTGAPSTTSSTTQPVPNSTSVPQPHRLDLGEGLPRLADYANLTVTVAAATIGNIEPRTFVAETPQVADQTYVFLTLDLANRSRSEGVISTQLPLTLLVDDQRAPVAEVPLGRNNMALGPLAESQKVIAFAVSPDAVFTNMVLEIADPERIPTYLPLTGELPVSGYPISLDVSGTGPAQGGASGCNQSLEVTMLDGAVSIDLLDSENAPTAYGSRRARLGERFLSLGVRILNNGGSWCGAGATNYAPSSFVLLVDDVPRAPVTFLSGIIAAGTTMDVTVNFVFPMDATKVEFATGTEAGTLFTVPIDMSDLPLLQGES